MQGKFAQFTLVVKDRESALAFYTEKVGFEKKTDVSTPGGYRWVTVGLPGEALELALYQLGSGADPSQRAWEKDWSPGRSPPVVIRVNDCRMTYEELRARGVRFVQPPAEYPWGVAATFTDPDGNLFSLHQPPVDRSRS